MVGEEAESWQRWRPEAAQRIPQPLWPTQTQPRMPLSPTQVAVECPVLAIERVPARDSPILRFVQAAIKRRV